MCFARLRMDTPGVYPYAKWKGTEIFSTELLVIQVVAPYLKALRRSTGGAWSWCLVYLVVPADLTRHSSPGINPFRRSHIFAVVGGMMVAWEDVAINGRASRSSWGLCLPLIRPIGSRRSPEVFVMERSEEHTSELQSRLHLVCRLLLEKKKNNIETRSAV